MPYIPLRAAGASTMNPAPGTARMPPSATSATTYFSSFDDTLSASPPPRARSSSSDASSSLSSTSGAHDPSPSSSTSSSPPSPSSSCASSPSSPRHVEPARTAAKRPVPPPPSGHCSLSPLSEPTPKRRSPSPTQDSPVAISLPPSQSRPRPSTLSLPPPSLRPASRTSGTTLPTVEVALAEKIPFPPKFSIIDNIRQLKTHLLARRYVRPRQIKTLNARLLRLLRREFLAEASLTSLIRNLGHGDRTVLHISWALAVSLWQRSLLGYSPPYNPRAAEPPYRNPEGGASLSLPALGPGGSVLASLRDGIMNAKSLHDALVCIEKHCEPA